MTRVSQYVWPVVALVTSFIAVFALTWLFSEERSQISDRPSESPSSEAPSPSPSPPAQEEGSVLEVRGVRLPAPEPPADGTAIVPNVLEFRSGKVCVVQTFVGKGWTLVAADPPDQYGRICRSVLPGQTVDLKFVHR